MFIIGEADKGDEDEGAVVSASSQSCKRPDEGNGIRGKLLRWRWTSLINCQISSQPSESWNDNAISRFDVGSVQTMRVSGISVVLIGPIT